MEFIKAKIFPSQTAGSALFSLPLVSNEYSSSQPTGFLKIT